ncbi:MAG TPA: cellulase family glycosylhydrolase, partial [Candidatus Didemnitutus sp.]|nr:cellulase family glycosylhydrolase [Candidatus Didemnitutus sp.]
MKTFLSSLLALVLASAPLVVRAEPAPTTPAKPSIWGSDQPRRPVENPKAKVLPLIAVKRNKFVNPAGETILFRGVSLADPENIDEQGHWNRELFVGVKDLGANLVRLPVHPIAWRDRTPAGYLKLLDQAVDWCTDLGMYVIIDWHSIGNLKSGMYQAPIYDTSIPETLAFWKTIALHFKGHNTVAFYELFNEPTHFNGMLGTMSWTEWRELNEEMIGVIRFWDKERIPLVAGFDWAYDLNPLHYEPVRAENIGYIVHPYAHKRTQPWEPKWEENFAFASGKYPIIATEWGFGLKDGEVVDD